MFGIGGVKLSLVELLVATVGGGGGLAVMLLFSMTDCCLGSPFCRLVLGGGRKSELSVSFFFSGVDMFMSECCGDIVLLAVGCFEIYILWD